MLTSCHWCEDNLLVAIYQFKAYKQLDTRGCIQGTVSPLEQEAVPLCNIIQPLLVFFLMHTVSEDQGLSDFWLPLAISSFSILSTSA
jgi:hypothetical protein